MSDFHDRIREYRSGSPKWSLGFDLLSLNNQLFNSVVETCAHRGLSRVRFLEELALVFLEEVEHRKSEALQNAMRQPPRPMIVCSCSTSDEQKAEFGADASVRFDYVGPTLDDIMREADQ